MVRGGAAFGVFDVGASCCARAGSASSAVLSTSAKGRRMGARRWEWEAGPIVGVPRLDTRRARKVDLPAGTIDVLAVPGRTDKTITVIVTRSVTPSGGHHARRNRSRHRHAARARRAERPGSPPP